MVVCFFPFLKGEVCVFTVFGHAGVGLVCVYVREFPRMVLEVKALRGVCMWARVRSRYHGNGGRVFDVNWLTAVASN